MLPMQWREAPGNSDYIVSIQVPRRQFSHLISRGLAEGDKYEICFTPQPTKNQTWKQHQQDKGWLAVFIGEMEPHSGTHLALVRRVTVPKSFNLKMTPTPDLSGKIRASLTGKALPVFLDLQNSTCETEKGTEARRNLSVAE